MQLPLVPLLHEASKADIRGDKLRLVVRTELIFLYAGKQA